MNTLLQIATDANSFQGWASIIQVVISAVTAFFLIQTFVLQAKTLKEQQEITKIEQNRFILQFLPSLSIRYDGASSGSPSGYTTDAMAGFDVFVSENYIQDLTVRLSGDDRIFCEYQEQDPNLIIPVGGKIFFLCLFTWKDFIPTKFVKSYRKYIHLTYKDAIGTSYEQTIIFNATGNHDVAIQPARRL